jgi:hypothetical protein
MLIKFLNKEPRLVGARHYIAGDVADLPEAVAKRLIRRIAERTTEQPKMAEQTPNPNPPPAGQPETATIKAEMENPESRRDAGKGKQPKQA